MTEVRFLSSVQGYQEGRVEAIASRLRQERPELQVVVVPPAESRAPLEAHKLKFGPAVLVDDRLEFVGIPRYRMLLERISKSVAARRATAAAPPAGPSR